MTLEDDLSLALAMARAGAEVALSLLGPALSTRTKLDGSVVTEADLAVERRLLETLESARPEDAIVSEERGALGSGERRWILDPIDGTHWFAAGEETWGTHIALEQDGEMVVGVISRPARGQCFWAARGLGAHRGTLQSDFSEQRLRVSDTVELAASRVMVWAPPRDPRHDLLRTHARQADPSIDGVLELAAGSLEAVVDTQGALWDMAPAVVLVEEAGGRFTDAEGGRDVGRLGAWLTNGRVDAALRALLA